MTQRVVGLLALAVLVCAVAGHIAHDGAHHHHHHEHEHEHVGGATWREVPTTGSVPTWDQMQTTLQAWFEKNNYPSKVPQADFDALVAQLNTTENTLLVGIADWTVYFAKQVPISDYHVGAAVKGKSGMTYLGGNMEFQGVPLIATMHAEQSATHHAISSGDGVLKIGINAAPCGYCRQFLSELHNAVNVTVVVHGPFTPKVYTGLVEIPVADVAGGNVMLPYFFGPTQLGQTSGMDDTAPWILTGYTAPDQLANATAEAAKRSYAPYSLIPAAVGIQFADGTQFFGLYLENAAYNPSLEPVVASINLSILNNYDPRTIVDAVLIEAQCCDKPTPAGHPKYPSIDHLFWTQTVLGAISNVTLRHARVQLTREPPSE